jgi:hypothetical protein
MSETATSAVSLLRLYADDDGDTRFGTAKIALTLQDFAPPAAPFNVSDGQGATRFVVIRLPAGWIGEPHPSPRPQVLFCLAGRLKITCSTGETATIETGMGLIMSDVNGKGHKTEVISPMPVDAVIIQ